MSAEVLEIVKLEDGGVALRKADDSNAEPVITIKFSEETVDSLQQQYVGVAQAMIAAGVQLIVEAKLRFEEEKEKPVVH
ncbi:MAG: hypothetical protein V7677_04850 [Motiliproteus sp.]